MWYNHIEGDNVKDNSAFKWIIISLLVVVIGLFAVIIVLIDKNEDYREKLRENNNYVNNDLFDDKIDNDKNNEIQDNQNNQDNNTQNKDQITDNHVSENQSSSYIGKDKALSIVLNHANVSKNNIFDLDIELERKYGSVVYEIDFKYNKYEYEYYVDATSGKIIHSFKEID